MQNLTWELSLVEARRTSEKRAWNVAKASLALSFLVIIGFALSMPFRQIVVRVVEVDKLTGDTGVAGDMPAYVSTRNDINDKHWVKQFVIAHERYVGKILQKDFDTIKILSGDVVYGKFRAQFEGPNALQSKLGFRVEIVPTILSTTLTSPNIATVRFETKTIDLQNPGAIPQVSRYIATLSYKYTPNPYGKEADLVDNPFGFAVESYQVDPDATADNPPPVATVPAMSATAAPAAQPVPVVPAIAGGKL